MRGLIIVIRELLAKSKDGTATFLDWLRALDVVIHLIIDDQQGFGEDSSPELEAELREAAGELMQDSGEPAGMQMGPVVSVLLPILLKYLMAQVAKHVDG